MYLGLRGNFLGIKPCLGKLIAARRATPRLAYFLIAVCLFIHARNLPLPNKLTRDSPNITKLPCRGYFTTAFLSIPQICAFCSLCACFWKKSQRQTIHDVLSKNLNLLIHVIQEMC